MLFTKSILKKSQKSDGLRFSVMSRHTLDDGVTPNSKITTGSYDVWLRELAPPDKLIGSYIKKRISWSEYKQQYISFLSSKEPEVKKLAKRALNQDVTILCIEIDSKFCHRKILAYECKKYEPGLIIKHR